MALPLNYNEPYWAEIYDDFNNTPRHRKEKEFYCSVAKKIGGRVLELGCGTGAILLPMLKLGIDVYGLDISSPMLKGLLEKCKIENIHDIDKRISLGNMINFKYPMKFNLIIIPNRSFLHIIKRGQQIRTLINIHKHLLSGGKLIMNFFNPQVDILLKYPYIKKRILYLRTVRNVYNNHRVKIFFSQYNDLLNQIMNIKYIFKEHSSNRKIIKEITSLVTLRWMYKEETLLLLHYAGFKQVDVFGDFLRMAQSDDSELVFVATKTKIQK